MRTTPRLRATHSSRRRLLTAAVELGLLAGLVVQPTLAGASPVDSSAVGQDAAGQHGVGDPTSLTVSTSLIRDLGDLGNFALTPRRLLAPPAAAVQVPTPMIVLSPDVPAVLPVPVPVADPPPAPPVAVAPPAPAPPVAPPPPPPPPPASSAGEIAIAAARTMIGRPYVWGGASPSGFDCSGLTMWAFAHAGISLPHLTNSQYAMSRHISMSDLQPGDLVFTRDLGHVGIYIGGGMMIHAPHSGTNVQISSISSVGMVLAGRI